VSQRKADGVGQVTHLRCQGPAALDDLLQDVGGVALPGQPLRPCLVHLLEDPDRFGVLPQRGVRNALAPGATETAEVPRETVTAGRCR
jgi:hypothetical protein